MWADLPKSLVAGVALGLGAASRNQMRLPWWEEATGRLLVIAHRGASRMAPENTLGAFREAKRQGADALELDIRRCRSGELVVMHDVELSRMTGVPLRVTDCTLAELRTLEIHGGERIPTLEEVLTDPDCPSRVNIEIKAERRETDGVEAALVRLLDRIDARSRVVVSSFNPFALARLARLAPAIPRAFLFSADAEYRFLRRPYLAPLVRPHVLNPHHALVTALFMRQARLLGYRVMPWTVDASADWERLIRLGVDGIITNLPGALREYVGQDQSRL